MLSNEKIEMFLRHKSIPSKGTTIKILQELLMLREVKKCADGAIKIAQRFTDYACYCDDAVLNNDTGICYPCELNIKIDDYRQLCAKQDASKQDEGK